MTKHTDDVQVAALTEWILGHQDDTGCREAADTLGQMGAMSALIGMLDGPLTARCAFDIADTLAIHGELRVIPDMMRLRTDFGAVAHILNIAIRKIEGTDRTCCACGGHVDDDDYDDDDDDDEDDGEARGGSGTAGRDGSLSPPDHRQPDSRI